MISADCSGFPKAALCRSLPVASLTSLLQLSQFAFFALYRSQLSRHDAIKVSAFSFYVLQSELRQEAEVRYQESGAAQERVGSRIR